MSANVEKLQKNSSEFIENNCQNRKKQSKDEVDFVRTELFPPFKTHTTITTDGNHNNQLTISHNNTINNNNNNSQCSLLSKKQSPGTLYGDCEVKTSIKSSLSTLEKFSLFNLAKKKIDQNSIQNSTTNSKDKTKFVKTPSLARLLGNTYNTKKSESELMNASDLGNNGKGNITTPVNGSRRFGNAERFHKSSKEDVLSEVSLQDFREDKDLSAKAFRTISRSLGKLWWRRTHSVDISAPDPEYKVSYLGNVLTGWAKGEGCIEKPLNTLWRNYTQNHKPDVIMRMKICASGLKATTRQHGLTEYWANRITYCCAPQNYPRVFCWIYRHEGRKLKHELRCHAVLCSKESIAKDICATLRENLDRALRDFKREKISKQNARLSLANSVYENPSLPRRKILLSVGGNNYRPPMERSKSAPKLMAIEEAIGEEEGDDIEQTNEPEMQSCCQKDSLYPAMTLGRRRCRRGHSIRRTGKILKSCNSAILLNQQEQITTKESSLSSSSSSSRQQLTSSNIFRRDDIKQNYSITKVSDENEKTKSNSSLGSDEDDLEKVLSYHNYDTNSPLASELLSYFDMKINTKMSSNLLDDETIIFAPSLPSDRPPRSSLSMDNLDNCSDDEIDCHHHHRHHHHHHHHHHHDNHDDDLYDDLDYTDDVFLRESAILNLFHRNSLRRLTNLSIQNDENCIEPVKPDANVMSLIQQQQHQQQHQKHLDSDEGSISSGCETASTVTANMDDTSLKYAPNNNNNNNNHHQQQEQQQKKSETQQLGDDDNGELDQQQNFNETHQMATMPNETNEIKICNATINFKLSRPLGSIKRIKARNIRNRLDGDVSDSEISDESGFAEFQEQNLLQRSKTVIV